MNWLQRMLTEADNQTPCVLRILAISGGLEGLVMAGWDFFVRGTSFDFVHYGPGLAGTLVAVGVAFKLKASTETPS
jgi:hypothetical protein